jgi:hypothetical protein
MPPICANVDVVAIKKNKGVLVSFFISVCFFDDALFESMDNKFFVKSLKD